MGLGQARLSGTFIGVGVGPGDPELLTLKAVAAIRAAPVIAYPAPDRGDAFARRIAAPHIPHGRTEIAIRTPMTPERFPDAAVYDAAAAEIGDHLTAGRDVVCLCEGDPFVFGSFLYLHARIAPAHPTTVIPGVTSIVAGASAAGAALASKNDRLSILPATLD
ncbi:MAG: SAM-dependent methyltransferase, partial [Pseudomonadota bacterium]